MAPDDCAIDSEWLKTAHVNSEGVRKAGKCICKGASHGKYCQIRKFACGDRSQSFFVHFLYTTHKAIQTYVQTHTPHSHQVTGLFLLKRKRSP